MLSHICICLCSPDYLNDFSYVFHVHVYDGLGTVHLSWYWVYKSGRKLADNKSQCILYNYTKLKHQDEIKTIN